MITVGCEVALVFPENSSCPFLLQKILGPMGQQNYKLYRLHGQDNPWLSPEKRSLEDKQERPRLVCEVSEARTKEKIENREVHGEKCCGDVRTTKFHII